jgi:hypothetical protein
MNVSRYAFTALLVVTPISASAVWACDGPSISASCDRPARWADRYHSSDARLTITTEGNDVTLLVTNDVVAMQLSDRTFHRIEKKTKAAEREDDDNILSQAIKTAVLGSVRALLDHSAECRLRDLRDARYEEGRLVIVTKEGDHLFEDVKVNDRLVLADFSEHDARAFVREFQRAKSHVQ